jgi:hypothetical protein
MKKLIIFFLGIFILCSTVMCRKKDNTDDCPVCPTVTGFFPSHGKTGDSIRINGTNFTTNPEGLQLKVSFNGKDAVIKSVTAGQVIATVPDKCGTGPIRVYYDVELFGESASAFIYDRIGITSTFAGKCGGNTTDNSDPLLAEFRAPTKVFLDEPRGFVYVISEDDHTLSRVSSAGAKTIINTGSEVIQSGICDASGNIYLAFDSYIAKVDNSVTTVLTTIAGNETASGHTDAKGTAARFNFINDLLVDGDVMYIAENVYIRKMQISTLTVSTIAGSGIAGHADGAALTAKFNSVVSLALDKNQNLYLADWNNSRIRRLSNGIVTTVAGDGTAAVKNGIGTAAQLDKPRSVVVNNDATFLYFSDSFTSFIRKIDLSTAEVSHFSGDVTLTGSQDGPVEKATYFQPRGFVYSKNTDGFFMADYFNCKVRKITFQ